MVEPILAKEDTWWAPTNSAVTRASITEIEIKDSYTPDASVTVTDSWDASAAKDGSVMCYVIGAKLIIAGNGSGKVFMNQDSFWAFGNSFTASSAYQKVTSFKTNGILDSSKCTSMTGAFANMSSIKHLDLDCLDVSNVINMMMLFNNCQALERLDVSSWNVSNATTLKSAFGRCYKLKEIDLSAWLTSACANMETMFEQCEFVDIPGLSELDVSNVTSMSGMFYKCSNFNGDISKWDTSSCTTMSRMFQECVSLQKLNVSKWDTSACTDMSFMFYNCSSLGEIDVSNWDVSKVANFDHFAAHANLKRKGIENWKPTSATNMNALFHNCAEEELDLSGWDVSKNQFFCQMFENSPNLKRIKGLEKWDTSAGLGFDGMFERCSKLEEVDLSSFNTTKAKNNVSGSANGHKTATLQNMFLSCNNLKKVKLGPNFSINGDGTNTTAGNKLILPTPSTDYIAGADGNWYAFNGDPYAPNAIQDKTAETYFASFPLCQNEDVIVKNGSLIDVAKAIKEKNGATAKYTPAQFGAAIRAL